MFRRIAFVEFSERESLLNALQKDGSELEGYALVVNEAGGGGVFGLGGPFGGSRGSRGDSDKTVFVKGFDRSHSPETVRELCITRVCT